ncbi:MAG: S1C family serine protease [Verrucomicrobiota bacterium]
MSLLTASWRRFAWAPLLAGTCWGQPQVLELEAPRNLEDLQVIQDTLQARLEVARKATVTLELGGATGSGVIVNEEGLIYTAAHVSMRPGFKLRVTLSNGKELEGEGLGVVPETDASLARITTEGTYPHVPIAPAASVEQGDWCFSLGNAGGWDESRGSVVRLGRIVKVRGTTLQSDCALIGGDSGGPLFDMEGRLIGIHSRVGISAQNNMHVPMSEYYDHLEAMLAMEAVGVESREMLPGVDGFLGVATEEVEGGLRVLRVGRKTAAEDELEVGDVIVSLDDQPTLEKGGFGDRVRQMGQGAKIRLQVIRGQEELELQITLGGKSE